MSDTHKRKGGERLAPKVAKPPRQRNGNGKKTDARARKEKIRRRLLIALTVVAALIVALFVVYKLLVVKPDVDMPEEPDMPGVSAGIGEEPKSNHAVSGRKKDFFTFLVVGRDTGGGGNTDTIMVAAYDVPNQKLSVMNVPRDTMVNVSWDIKRINSVYNMAQNKGEDGILAMKKRMKDILGFVPDFHVVVEWEGFGKLVDAIGGVYFDVPINMNYDDPTQNLHIRIKKGPQMLDGKKAMQVIRFRDGNNNTGYREGDIGRIKTQQAFLKALVEQTLVPKNIVNIDKFAKIFAENVETDLSLNNLAYFGQCALIGGLKTDNVTFITMPFENHSVWSRSYSNYQSYVTPIADELIPLVNKHFNPYKEDVTLADLDLMSVNKNGTVSSSTGATKDKTAASSGGSSKPSGSKAPETTAPSKQPEATPAPTPSASVNPAASPSPTPPALPPDTSANPTPSGSPTPAPEVTPAPTPTAPPTPEPTPPAGPPEGYYFD